MYFDSGLFQAAFSEAVLNHIRSNYIKIAVYSRSKIVGIQELLNFIVAPAVRLALFFMDMGRNSNAGNLH